MKGPPFGAPEIKADSHIIHEKEYTPEMTILQDCVYVLSMIHCLYLYKIMQ